MYEKKYYYKYYSSIIVYSYNFINLCNCLCTTTGTATTRPSSSFYNTKYKQITVRSLQGNESQHQTQKLEIKRECEKRMIKNFDGINGLYVR